MKGVVLAEFVQFAEARFGVPPPPGAYNAVETYAYADLVGLVEATVGRAGMSAPEVLKSFGAHLFGRFTALYPVFFFDAGSAFDLLGRINTYVHGEVQKLYPDAEFPRFDVERTGNKRMELVYRSSRPLADLAEGLIRGCIAHFGQAIVVRREDLDPDGRAARFVLEAGGSASRRQPRS
jgi:hypothetical protein